jgi:hypothetical protein
MRRRLALLSMFVLFGVAHAVLDRVPGAAASALRGAAAHVLRVERPEAAAGSVD